MSQGRYGRESELKEIIKNADHIEKHIYTVYKHSQQPYIKLSEDNRRSESILEDQRRNYERRYVENIEELIIKTISEWKPTETEHESKVIEYARQRAESYKKEYDKEKPEKHINFKSPNKHFHESLLNIQSTYHAIRGYEIIKEIKHKLENSKEKLVPEFFTELLPEVTKLSPFSENPEFLIYDLVDRLEKEDEETQKETIPLAKEYIHKKSEALQNIVNTMIEEDSEILTEHEKQRARTYEGTNEQIYFVNNLIGKYYQRAIFNAKTRMDKDTYASEMDRIITKAKKEP